MLNGWYGVLPCNKPIPRQLCLPRYGITLEQDRYLDLGDALPQPAAKCPETEQLC